MNTTLLNAASGINTHQFGLDSVSNNIANVNTIGYRENRPEFKSLFSSSIDSLNSTSAVSNDLNYGVTAASNAINTNSGSFKQSDGELDMAYAGKGWFITGDSLGAKATIGKTDFGKSGNAYFTRDGTFSRDAQGYIVNSSGYYMLGVDLGKINNGIFDGSKSINDFENLAGTTLTPLRIPKDLYYKPILTTKADIALNLNKNENLENAYKAYSSDGKFDLDQFKKMDLNTIGANHKLANASVNNKFTLTLNDGARSHSYNFIYTNAKVVPQSQNGEIYFTTLEDLQKAIEKVSGLNLTVIRDNQGNIERQLALTLKNNSYQNYNINLQGSFLKQIGLEGATNDFSSGIAKNYAPKASYAPNDIVNFKGIAFRVLEATSANPLENKDAYEIIDTRGVLPFDNANNYSVDELVNFDNKIYKKISSANNAMPTDESQWELISEAKSSTAKNYQKDMDYKIGDVVMIDDVLYKRVNTDGSTNPKDDEDNWQKIRGSYFASSVIEVPTYTARTEIYDEGGRKYLIKSNLTLVNGGDNGKGDEVWSVKSAIVSANTQEPLSKIMQSSITFTPDGKVIAPVVNFDLDGKNIAYSMAGNKDAIDAKTTTNATYRNSGVIGVSQDGRGQGVLKEMRISTEGVIELLFSNGVQEPMGRVGLASFVNPQGLQKVGNNSLEMKYGLINGENAPLSGNPILGWDEAGKLQYGKVMHKYLETSNVDVGKSLTDLIILQKGYSMNAKAFTTGDELIKEAINLKR